MLVGHDGGVVLFGGQTASPPAGGKDLFDTWEYGPADGWSRIQEKDTSWSDAAAFDAGSGRVVVLLGGYGGTSVYDPGAATWSRRGPTGGPRSTLGMRAAYDVESDRTILLDENGRTWAFDLDTDTWTQMTATGPPSRLWHVMAYDNGSDRVILFGGTTSSNVDLGDTWAYDFNADAWLEMAPATNPPARRYAAMAYDPGTDRMILFGGATGPWRQEEPLADTWAYDYDTDTWTELSPATAPSPRGWHAMAYDPGSGLIVLFGGGPTRDEATAETWLFDPAGGSWIQPF